MREKHPKKSGRRRWIDGLRYLVSFGAIAVILSLFREQLPDVLKRLAGVDLPLFSLSLALYFVALVFIARRLQLFLQAQDTELSVGKLYYLNLVAMFFNNVLPSSLGGEAVKAYYVYRAANGKVDSVGAVLVDRLTGLLTLMGIGMAAVVFLRRAVQSERILYSIEVLAATTMPLLILIFSRRLGRRVDGLSVPWVPAGLTAKLKELLQAIHMFRGRTGVLGAAVLLSLLAQAIFVLSNFLLARSLFISIPLSFFIFFVPIMALVNLAPSVNGVGVREMTYVFYLAELTTPDKALALSILTTFILILIGVVGGIIYAFKGGYGPVTAADGAGDDRQYLG